MSIWGNRYSIYATHLLEEGVNIVTLKILLGHADITTTMIYLHVAQCKMIKPHSPPAAGFSLRGQWKHIGKNEDKYLYPVHQLSAAFKGKFLDSLKMKRKLRKLVQHRVLVGSSGPRVLLFIASSYVISLITIDIPTLTISFK